MCSIDSNFFVVKILKYCNLLERLTDYSDYGHQWIYAVFQQRTLKA